MFKRKELQKKNKIFKMSYIIAFDITEKQNIQFTRLSRNRFISFQLDAKKIYLKEYLLGRFENTSCYVILMKFPMSQLCEFSDH